MAERRRTKQGRTFITGLTFDQAWTFLMEKDHWATTMGYQDSKQYVSGVMETTGAVLFEYVGYFTPRKPPTDDQKAAKEWWVSDEGVKDENH